MMRPNDRSGHPSSLAATAWSARVALTAAGLCVMVSTPIAVVRAAAAGTPPAHLAATAAVGAAAVFLACLLLTTAAAALGAANLRWGARRGRRPAEALGAAAGLWLATGLGWASFSSLHLHTGASLIAWSALAASAIALGGWMGRRLAGVIEELAGGVDPAGERLIRATIVAAALAPAWPYLRRQRGRQPLTPRLVAVAAAAMIAAAAMMALALRTHTLTEPAYSVQHFAAGLIVMLAVALAALRTRPTARTAALVATAAVLTPIAAAVTYLPGPRLDWSRAQARHADKLGRFCLAALTPTVGGGSAIPAGWIAPLPPAPPTPRTAAMDRIQRDRPLIVLVIWDGWRIDQSSIYGYRRSRGPLVSTTPNLDRRRDAFLRFRWAFTQGGSTTTALRHLFTGRYSSRHMKKTRGIAPFWTNELARAGYEVFHLNILTNDVNGVSTDAFLRDMPADLRRRTVTLDCAYCEPSDKRREDHAVGNARATPAVLEAARDKITFIECNRQNEQKAVADLLAFLAARGDHGRGVFAFIHMDLTHQPWRAFADGPAFGSGLADRCDHVTHRSDRITGKLLDGLEALGAWEEAIVILTADHGELPTGGGGYPWRVRTQVPLLVKLPGVDGRDIENLVGLFDIGPTLVDAVAPGAMGRFEGRSLWPLLADADRRRRVLFGLHAFQDCYYLVASDGLQYIYHRGLGYEELFNWRTDPANRHDLAGRDRRATRLGRRYMHWFLDVHGRRRAYNLDRAHRRRDDGPDYRGD